MATEQKAKKRMLRFSLSKREDSLKWHFSFHQHSKDTLLTQWRNPRVQSKKCEIKNKLEKQSKTPNQYRKRFSSSWKRHPGLNSGALSLYEWMLAVCPMWVVRLGKLWFRPGQPQKYWFESGNDLCRAAEQFMGLCVVWLHKTKGQNSFAWYGEMGGAKGALCITKSTLELQLIKHDTLFLFVQTSQ